MRAPIFVLLLMLLSAGGACGQLRIVDYNTAGDSRPGMATILAAIGAQSLNGVSKAPDVFTLEEQTSSATTTQAIVNVLNAIYGAGTYARATIEGGTTGAGHPGLIYNTKTVSLIATTTASTLSTAGAARQTMRYELRPVGYDETADFYVYASHYKASTGSENAARRNGEALEVRANADALGEGASIIYAGDFNIYSSSEAMWGTLTKAGAGQAFDPINSVGAWSNNAAFKAVHTQSPVTTARYGGQVTGGMDDRFDFQLVSGELLDNEGLSYLAGSYNAFGNTGTHAINGEITSGSAAAFQALLPGYTLQQATDVLNALAATSDHLPVVAQYQLPAKMQVSVGGVPTRVIVGAAANVNVTISNVAPVAAAIGADELDYVASGTGAVSGSKGGSVLALNPGAVVGLTLATGTVGAQTGGLEVHSTSQQAANKDFSTTIGYEVVDHAHPVFGSAFGAATLSLDLGDVAQFAGPITMTFSLGNAFSSLGASAGLDLDAFQLSGTGAFFTNLALFSGLAAGEAVTFYVGLATDETGSFHGTYQLTFSDENLLGATNVGTLTLEVTGRVVAVPEPGTLALLVLGGMGVALFGRRLSRRS